MTAPTRAGRIAEAADEKVSGWLELAGIPGSIYPCQSGGFLVDIGEQFPTWRHDMGAVRLLLLERDLIAAELANA